MLSTRATRYLQEVLPELAAASVISHPLPGAIDLSLAQNLLIREEVEEICNNGMRVAAQNETLWKLPPFGGDNDTRSAIAKFLNNDFRPTKEVLMDQISLTAGAGSAVEALVYSICDEGDAVIILGPHWFGFAPYINMRPKVQIVTVSLPSTDGGGDDIFPALQKTYEAAKSLRKAKALIVTNPGNPTSTCLSDTSMRECMRFCRENGLHLIVDEIYALATIQGSSSGRQGFRSALSLLNASSDTERWIDPAQVHVVWSASKLFGLCGPRIGCMISQSNPALHAAVSLLAYASVSATSASMLTAILSSAKLGALIETNSQRLTDSYKCFIALFEQFGVQYVPAQEGLFIFAQLNQKALGPEDEGRFIADVAAIGVMVSPGSLYGSSAAAYGWARITFAVPLPIAQEAIRRLKQYLEQIKTE